jgi:hypothetical protein
MSYTEALEAAGARVEKFQKFGSYQGYWLALVGFQGRKLWVHCRFGSYSGCDAFEAYAPRKCQEHRYCSSSEKPGQCTACDSAKVEYETRLATFGLQHLTAGEMNDAEAIKMARDYCYGEGTEIEAFVRRNAIDTVAMASIAEVD